MVESQLSMLLVASSILVSRSNLFSHLSFYSVLGELRQKD